MQQTDGDGYTASASYFAQQCRDSDWNTSSDSACALYGVCVEDMLNRNYAGLPQSAIEAQCYAQYINTVPVEDPPVVDEPSEDPPVQYYDPCEKCDRSRCRLL